MVGANSHAITASGITLDEDAHTATGPAGNIDLTPREFELMACLMKNAGKVVSREELLRDAWGWEYLTETKTVDTHIKRLRDKIEQADTIPALWKRFAVTDTGSSYKTAADIFRASGNAAQLACGRRCLVACMLLFDASILSLLVLVPISVVVFCLSLLIGHFLSEPLSDLAKKTAAYRNGADIPFEPDGRMLEPIG